MRKVELGGILERVIVQIRQGKEVGRILPHTHGGSPQTELRVDNSLVVKAGSKFHGEGLYGLL